MKEVDSNLPNEILKSVRDVEIEKFIEEEGDALRSQLCLWHIENKKGHHGNFGSAYQCMDCMKEIEKGRCEVDIENLTLIWSITSVASGKKLISKEKMNAGLGLELYVKINTRQLLT